MIEKGKDESEDKDRKSLSFIHKLFDMVEAPMLDPLIRWAPNNQSFIVIPNEHFTEALSQYFKHANIASFIRQLNMYGFHKVSESHPGEKKANSNNVGIVTPQWEFRHSLGAFRRGDLEGLKLVKRRTFKSNGSNTRNNSGSGAAMGAGNTTQTNHINNNSNSNNNLNENDNIKLEKEAKMYDAQEQYEFQSYTPHNRLKSLENEGESVHEQQHIQQQTQQGIQQQQHHQQGGQQAQHVPPQIQIASSHPGAPQQIATPMYSAPPSMLYGQCAPQIAELQLKLMETNRALDRLTKVNDIFKEELNLLNYDMVGFIDLIKDQVKDEKPLMEFRSRILQRSATRDMTIKRLSLSHSNDVWEKSNSISSGPIHAPQANSFRMTQTQMPMTAAAGTVPSQIPSQPNGAVIQSFGRNPSTTSITSNPYFSGVPATTNHYFPDYYYQQQVQQAQYRNVNPVSDGIFAHKDIRYSTSASVGQLRSRNPSIHDPLAPNRPSSSQVMNATTNANHPQANLMQQLQPQTQPQAQAIGNNLVASVPSSPTPTDGSKRNKRSSAVYAMLNNEENGNSDPVKKVKI